MSGLYYMPNRFAIEDCYLIFLGVRYCNNSNHSMAFNAISDSKLCNCTNAPIIEINNTDTWCFKASLDS